MSKLLEKVYEIYPDDRDEQQRRGFIHGYRKALEDVEKFVESLTTNAHEMPDSHILKKYCTGIDDTVVDIFNFIEDLEEDEKA